MGVGVAGATPTAERKRGGFSPPYMPPTSRERLPRGVESRLRHSPSHTGFGVDRRDDDVMKGGIAKYFEKWMRNRLE